MNQQLTKVLLTVPEAAEALGISRSKLYDLVSRGRLRHVKLGKSKSAGCRFRPQDLQAFADQHVVG